MLFTRSQLISKIQVIPVTGCWLFLGSLNRYGRGRLFDGRKELMADRLFYEAWIEPIEPHYFLHHPLPPNQCIGPACCYPSHAAINRLMNDTSRSAPSAIRILKEGLLSQVRMLPETGCWEWQGVKDGDGYGKLRIDGEWCQARRVFYQTWIHKPSEGKRLIPLLPKGQCIGVPCCNPDHFGIQGRVASHRHSADEDSCAAAQT